MNHDQAVIPYDDGMLVNTPSGKAMRALSYEEVPGLRCQQYLSEAADQRMARSLTAGRWWRWLSRYAEHRADRLRR